MKQHDGRGIVQQRLPFDQHRQPPGRPQLFEQFDDGDRVGRGNQRPEQQRRHEMDLQGIPHPRSHQKGGNQHARDRQHQNGDDVHQQRPGIQGQCRLEDQGGKKQEKNDIGSDMKLADLFSDGKTGRDLVQQHTQQHQQYRVGQQQLLAQAGDHHGQGQQDCRDQYDFRERHGNG